MSSQPSEPGVADLEKITTAAPASARERVRARVLRSVDSWLVVVAVGALLVASLRLMPFQTPFPLSAIEAEARWAGAAAIVGLAIALLRRSRRTALALGASLVVLVPWSLEWLPAALAHEGGRHVDLRVLTTNLLAPSPTPALAREIRDSEADVVLVQEASDEWWDVLEAEGVLARYPHRVEETHSFREDYMGIAILSRLPIVRSGVARLGGTYVPYAWADVLVGERTVRVLSIHTWPPYVPELLELHLRQMAHLRALARADLADPALDAVIFAGDYNASPMSRQYRLLRDTGLVSAHERVGRGFATTWPNLAVPIPPMRLDHVLVGGRGVEVVSVREGIGEGSDHLPVFVELSLAP
ncbi:MAG: endonuclease/exonuclease/phosphatase family protein [Sandaracinaceae bacterium]|nr:endonuclease/exonuclease/phosphatase family protein [Sandaracinaceae bacterium]